MQALRIGTAVSPSVASWRPSKPFRSSRMQRPANSAPRAVIVTCREFRIQRAVEPSRERTGWVGDSWRIASLRINARSSSRSAWKLAGRRAMVSDQTSIDKLQRGPKSLNVGVLRQSEAEVLTVQLD